MSFFKKKITNNILANKKIFEYPEFPLYSLRHDVWNGEIEIIFAEEENLQNKLQLRFEKVSACYFQNGYGSDRFMFDKQDLGFQMMELDVMDSPQEMGAGGDFSSKANISIELGDLSLSIECQTIVIDEEVFELLE